jgi:predicted alpha/beta hydrolase
MVGEEMDSLTFQPISLRCRDGYHLHGHLWPGRGQADATVIINPATGVLASYYHRYARFLAGQGFNAVTYDYRGIGLSRSGRGFGPGMRWRDWGELDFDAVIDWVHARHPRLPLLVVGHSIGGFLPGFAQGAGRIGRMLTVGAQYAYWRDYAADKRLGLLLKWHLTMPILTTLLGHFPGRRLGWLEDLPAGVAHEWSFRRARMEASYPAAERPHILHRFAAVRAPILAIGTSDDEFGTPSAILRALAYYRGAERHFVQLAPTDLGSPAIGHFGLFHDRFAASFWPLSCDWLRGKPMPWPHHTELPAED